MKTEEGVGDLKSVRCSQSHCISLLKFINDFRIVTSTVPSSPRTPCAVCLHRSGHGLPNTISLRRFFPCVILSFIFLVLPLSFLIRAVYFSKDFFVMEGRGGKQAGETPQNNCKMPLKDWLSTLHNSSPWFKSKEALLRHLQLSGIRTAFRHVLFSNIWQEGCRRSATCEEVEVEPPPFLPLIYNSFLEDREEYYTDLSREEKLVSVVYWTVMFQFDSKNTNMLVLQYWRWREDSNTFQGK